MQPLHDGLSPALSAGMLATSRQPSHSAINTASPDHQEAVIITVPPSVHTAGLIHIHHMIEVSAIGTTRDARQRTDNAVPIPSYNSSTEGRECV